jgi:hypothetical protein
MGEQKLKQRKIKIPFFKKKERKKENGVSTLLLDFVLGYFQISFLVFYFGN